MRRLHLAAVMVVIVIFAGSDALAQTQAAAASPVWADAANWESVHPVATRNIVYANVPILGNPSANPNLGIAGGGMPPVPNCSASSRPNSSKPNK